MLHMYIYVLYNVYLSPSVYTYTCIYINIHVQDVPHVLYRVYTLYKPISNHYMQCSRTCSLHYACIINKCTTCTCTCAKGSVTLVTALPLPRMFLWQHSFQTCICTHTHSHTHSMLVDIQNNTHNNVRRDNQTKETLDRQSNTLSSTQTRQLFLVIALSGI